MCAESALVAADERDPSSRRQLVSRRAEKRERHRLRVQQLRGLWVVRRHGEDAVVAVACGFRQCRRVEVVEVLGDGDAPTGRMAQVAGDARQELAVGRIIEAESQENAFGFRHDADSIAKKSEKCWLISRFDFAILSARR